MYFGMMSLNDALNQLQNLLLELTKSFAETLQFECIEIRIYKYFSKN